MLTPIEEIKSRLDIVQVLSDYIKLQKAGSNLRALCPFHSEKTPSFMVSPSRQIWHCFGGCNEGGDIFKFVMKIEGLEFGDALRRLADRAGVQLKREDPQIRTERGKSADICRHAVEYFQNNLKQNVQAREYFLKRGIKEETISEFRLGYSPESWDGLLKYLSAKNFHPQDAEKAGLVVKNENGKIFDRFRGRLMFPIANSSGEIIAFGGRIFDAEGDAAKYINSPQSLIYDKSRTLYGFDKAKTEIRKNNFALVVEGYMDLIMSHQAGVKNAVAVSGTALTREHLRILKRLCDNLYFSFDTDGAGQEATKKAIDMALEEDFNIKIVSAPSGKDPADFILAFPADWPGQMQKAKSFMEFYFDNALSQNDTETAEGKKNISKILLLQIKKLKNRVEQSHWISLVAQKLKVRPVVLEEEILKMQTDDFFPIENSQELPAQNKQSKEELLLERIAACALKQPDLRKHLAGLEIEPVLGYNSSQLIGIIKDADSSVVSEKQFALHIAEYNPQLMDFAKGLLFSLEAFEDMPDLEEEIKFCVNEYNAQQIKKKQSELSVKIQEAERAGDEIAVQKLMDDFKILTSRLQQSFD